MNIFLFISLMASLIYAGFCMPQNKKDADSSAFSTGDGNKILELLGKEIKNQMNQLGAELKMEFSLLKDHIKNQTLNSGSGSNSTADSPTLTTPRFYAVEQCKDAWFAPSPGWENKCIQVPPYMNKKSSSVKVGGHCLLICASANCGNPEGGKKCIEIHPDSYGLDDLKKINYNNQISSFRLCKKE